MAGFNFPTEPRHCDQHGDYLAMNTPAGWSDCPRCNALRQQAELLRQEALAYEQSQMRRAAIPERFFDRRIGTYQPVNPKAGYAQDIVQAYADDFAAVRKSGRSLILCGGVGTGKTHLAVGALHQVVAAGYTGLYAVLLDAFRSIKDTYRKDSQLSESTVLARFAAPDLLVLDEIGVQNGSDTERMLMFSILNERYNQLKPTVLISNLAKGPLEAHLGERAFDRMREGGGRMVVFDWSSFRGAQA